MHTFRIKPKQIPNFADNSVACFKYSLNDQQSLSTFCRYCQAWQVPSLIHCSMAYQNYILCFRALYISAICKCLLDASSLLSQIRQRCQFNVCTSINTHVAVECRSLCCSCLLMLHCDTIRVV